MQPNNNVLPFRAPAHLGEFNEQLHSVQLPRLNGEPALRQLLLVANKDLLVRSLFAATSTGHRDAARSRSFLLNAVNTANKNSAANAPPSQGNPPPQANPSPQQRRYEGDQPTRAGNDDQSRPPADGNQGFQNQTRTQGHPNSGQRQDQSRHRDSQRPSGNDAGNGQNGRSGEANFARQEKAFGGKAALCIEADTSRSRKTPTVRFELALLCGEREYDWSKKLSVQLTRMELPIVCAVFLGMLESYEMKNHGPDSSKWLSIQHQGKVIFVKAGAKDVPLRALPVGPGDAVYMAGLLLAQLQAAMHGMDMQGVLAIVQRVAASMTNAASAAPGNNGQQRAQR